MTTGTVEERGGGEAETATVPPVEVTAAIVSYNGRKVEATEGARRVHNVLATRAGA